MNLKNKDSYRLKKQTYGCRRSGESQGKGIIREFEMDMYTLLYLKWITSRDLLYSTWDSSQCSVADWKGGGVCRRMDTCICMAESLPCSPEIITTLLIGCTLIPNKKLKKKKDRSLKIIFRISLGIIRKKFLSSQVLVPV